MKQSVSSEQVQDTRERWKIEADLRRDLGITKDSPEATNLGMAAVNWLLKPVEGKEAKERREKIERIVNRAKSLFPVARPILMRLRLHATAVADGNGRDDRKSPYKMCTLCDKSVERASTDRTVNNGVPSHKNCNKMIEHRAERIFGTAAVPAAVAVSGQQSASRQLSA
jgi:hypothetical protein